MKQKNDGIGPLQEETGKDGILFLKPQSKVGTKDLIKANLPSSCMND